MFVCTCIDFHFISAVVYFVNSLLYINFMSVLSFLLIDNIVKMFYYYYYYYYMCLRSYRRKFIATHTNNEIEPATALSAGGLL